MSAIVVMRSGARVDLAKPKADTLFLRDIAEGLAKTPMYGGATWGFYSHAQHATLLAAEAAREEGPQAGLYALLHHAHIAFAGFEMLNSAEAWRKRRDAIMRAVHEACDLDWPMPREIANALAIAHACVEMTELRQLCTDCDAEVAALERNGAHSLRGAIKPKAWDRALDGFIEALRVNAVAAQLPKMPIWGDIL
jgi:hypothetical protein